MSSSILIIVPTLDSYELLPRLIKSLQYQTLSNWRLVFVDGPSSYSHRSWLASCCESDSRCTWVTQNTSNPGIFGAMNQGFELALPSDWIIFWGSDDWAPEPTVLADVLDEIQASSFEPDLVVCRARYVNSISGASSRRSSFHPSGFLNSADFRRSLFLGSTPPHQATLFGPGSRLRLARYSPAFKLSADLDYFLKISSFTDLSIQCLDLELVHMSDGGVSGQQTQRRIAEVIRAYQHTFGSAWPIPFLLRYFKRFVSLLNVL